MSTTFEEQYKYVPFLAMLFVSIAIAYPVLAHKSILTPAGIFSATVFVAPIWFMLGNIIAEVYGYKLSMKIFWSTFVCQFIAAIICHYLIQLNSPSYWHGQASYDFVLGHFLALTTVEAVALIISWRMNAYFLTKWKIQLNGKYFWLRSIGSTSLAEIIFTFMLIPTFFWFSSVRGIKAIAILFLWTCALRVISTAVLTVFSSICVYILKRAERSDVFETAENFNPFRLA